jgi:hypothetical protein
MEIVLVAAVGAMCIACFLVGAKVGQTVSKGEDIKLPTVNPIEAYREHEQKKAARDEQERMEAILRNIESYDGTGDRQEDVPGR